MFEIEKINLVNFVVVVTVEAFAAGSDGSIGTSETLLEISKINLVYIFVLIKISEWLRTRTRGSAARCADPLIVAGAIIACCVSAHT